MTFIGDSSGLPNANVERIVAQAVDAIRSEARNETAPWVVSACPICAVLVDWLASAAFCSQVVASLGKITREQLILQRRRVPARAEPRAQGRSLRSMT